MPTVSLYPSHLSPQLFVPVATYLHVECPVVSSPSIDVRLFWELWHSDGAAWAFWAGGWRTVGGWAGRTQLDMAGACGMYSKACPFLSKGDCEGSGQAPDTGHPPPPLAARPPPAASLAARLAVPRGLYARASHPPPFDRHTQPSCLPPALSSSRGAIQRALTDFSKPAPVSRSGKGSAALCGLPPPRVSPLPAAAHPPRPRAWGLQALLIPPSPNPLWRSDQVLPAPEPRRQDAAGQVLHAAV